MLQVVQKHVVEIPFFFSLFYVGTEMPWALSCVAEEIFQLCAQEVSAESCKKLLVCSLKNATDLMKNNLTQAKGVNDSIKFICNSSGKQMVGQSLYQPTTGL